MPLAIDKESISKIRTLQGSEAETIVEMAREISADPSKFFQFEDWSGLDLRSCDLTGISFFGAIMDNVLIYRDQFHLIEETGPKSFKQPKIFERQTKRQANQSHSLSEGFNSLFQQGKPDFGTAVDLKLVNEFKERFAGVYELYRFNTSTVAAPDQTVNKTRQKEILQLSRAGLQIFAGEKANILPTFCLRTMLRENASKTSESTVRGAVFLAGKQVFLSGKNAESESLFTLAFEYDDGSKDERTAIMMKPATDGRFFSTRVLLRRLRHVEKIDDIASPIGFLEEADLPKELASLQELLSTDPIDPELKILSDATQKRS